MMNKISAKYTKSEYSKELHLVIHIDDVALDKLLELHYPSEGFLGLVPTLLNWLTDEKERKIIWERIDDDCRQIVPILVCPDDLDFSCILINVDIQKTKHTVKWVKFGIEQGMTRHSPGTIGRHVKWLDKIKPMEFDRKDYDAFISVFRDALSNNIG